MISLFVNNKAFQYEDSEFPLLDPVGFVFSVNDYPEYFKNDKNFIKKPSNLETFCYKEGKWFFEVIIIFSIVLSLFFIQNSYFSD